jgi:hypothetical protein
MPKLLADRLADDSIHRFRAAALMRNDEALALLSSGRHAAAVYLSGYVAEMTLKAAWFALLGYDEDAKITPNDLRAAVKLAQSNYAITFPNLHGVWHWALLLSRHRMTLGQGYADPAFGLEMVEHSQRIYTRWRETLRYKTNRPYRSEVDVVRDSAQWLLDRAIEL